MANETIEVLRIPGTLFPRGAFDENASYKFLNIVESGGSGYVCLQPCTGIPVTNTAYWFKFVFKGDKGDAFTYADLTAEQKAELVRDATAAAQAAASSAQSAADDAAAALQKFNTIKAAIDAIDPQSTEGSIQTLAAKQGLLEADLNALGPKIEQIYKETTTEQITFASGGVITFDDITLDSEGDYIEFEVATSVQVNQNGRAFCGYDNDFAIGLVGYQCGLRNSSGVNVSGFDFSNGQYNFREDVGTLVEMGKVRIEYGSGVVKLYVKNELVKETTVTNLPTIKINKMGTWTSSNSTTYYWTGTIYGFKYCHNGTVITNISKLPEFTSNEYITITHNSATSGILSTIQQDIADLGDDVESINDNIDSLRDDLDDVEQISDAVSPIINAVANLGWTYQYSFNGSTSAAALTTPIALSQNGDSLEIEFGTITTTGNLQLNGGYAFSNNTQTDGWTGIGVSDTYLSLRTDDKTWVLNAKAVNLSNKKLRIIYEEGNIKVYSNTTLLTTYTGQKNITIDKMGDAYSDKHWDGIIVSIKLNGSYVKLADIATLSNVTELALTSFLSSDEKELLNSNAYSMMAKKTSSALDVYVKRANGDFVDFPLVKMESSSTFYDYWGIRYVKSAVFDNGVMTNGSSLFADSEAELAMYIKGDSNYYVGGHMHGFENIVGSTQAGGDDSAREIIFIIDNKVVGEDDEVALKLCSKVEAIMHTYLYPNDSQAEPFAEVVKHWIWTSEGLRITTSLTVLETTTFLNCYFGMMGVYRRESGSSSNGYLTNKAIKNNKPFTIYDTSDSWDSALKTLDSNCTKITAYGNLGYGFSLEVVDSNLTNDGMFVWHNNSAYNKIYYGMQSTNGEDFSGEWHATQIWRIE